MEAQSADGSATYQSYYSLLGIRRNASLAEIRVAYRKLALKWHPDRRGKESPKAADEAKLRFQRIQEAYSVLADNGKRAMYDAGLFDPFDDDDQDFTDFMVEMLSMMESRTPEVYDDTTLLQVVAGWFFSDIYGKFLSIFFLLQKPDTLEDLQKIFNEMVNAMEMGLGPSVGRKRARVE